MLKTISVMLATFLSSRRPAENCATETAEVERRHAQRVTDDHYLANIFLGQRCIFVPNEWEDPVVGRVEHIDVTRGVLCHVFDYVRNEPQVFIGFPSPQSRIVTDTPGRHSIWYEGKMYDGPYGHALTETLDALRVKRYMPPHGVGYYEAELLPHTGSLRFRMDFDLWKAKYNAGIDGYGPQPIVFNYPTQQHETMLRLAEVMNEPGDGSEVFVLIFHENVWHVCRDQGRETVARFPFSDIGYMGLTEYGMSSALIACHHLNRGNSYIPTPPRPVSFQQQLKEAFINFKKFALISGDLISARIAV